MEFWAIDPIKSNNRESFDRTCDDDVEPLLRSSDGKRQHTDRNNRLINFRIRK